jgi:hypothetical protein
MLLEYTPGGSINQADDLWMAEDYALNVGTFAPLARLGAIFGANALHLDDRQIGSVFKTVVY